jgi:hypothetical protein
LLSQNFDGRFVTEKPKPWRTFSLRCSCLRSSVLRVSLALKNFGKARSRP